MSINKIVAQQYREKINQAIRQVSDLSMPPEGWLRTVRNALGMSGTQLAKRLGVTKARVSRAERDELTGSVTLKSMKSMAEAMNCRFVYAVLPDQEIERLIQKRAVQKARERIEAASVHMALEAQALDDELVSFEVERIASEIREKMPSDLWSDE